VRFKLWLEANKQDFFNLAKAQRDLPEKAMLKFQRASGGGVMNSALENIGDLTHRMSEANTFGTAGYEFVKEKVVKMLNLLKNGYGFGREFTENMANNAPYFKMSYEDFRSKLFGLMDQYAEEHEKLPVYNRAQQLAKEAAVSLGRRNFKITISCLEELMKHLNSRDEWIAFAHEGLEE